jgi:uncharacterized protein YciI
VDVCFTQGVEFAYQLRPAFDRSFMSQATPEQRAVFEAHGEWLEERYAEGQVLFAGRCYDGPFGLVVLDAADEDEARRLMESDPSVREGVQTAELYPFKTFIARERVPA